MALQHLQWPALNLLNADLASKVHMAIAYGDSIKETLILTKDDMVYSFKSKRACENAIKIETMCGKNIKTFAIGSNYILALTHKGKVYSWDQQSLHSSEPTEIDINKECIDIICGSKYHVALTNDGEVFQWDNSKNFKVIALQISDSLPDINRVISVSCGFSHFVAVTNNGVVFSWGGNSYGQLGIRSNESSTNIYHVSFSQNVTVVKVVCGHAHTLALCGGGSLYAWGSNLFGQLGIGTEINMNSPVELENYRMGKVIDVAASSRCNISVAMAEGRKVFVWGECMGQSIRTPLYCPLTSLYSAFIYYQSPKKMDKPLIIEEQEMSVADYLQTAFDDSTTSDLIMQVHGKPIYVHKAILKIRSQYFRTMFQEHWKENDQNIIFHDQFPYNVYKAYLKYLYTGKVDVYGTDIVEFLSLADTYNEISLVKICKDAIIGGLTYENVMVYYNAAVDRHDEELEERCFRFALDHWTKVLGTPSFTELEASRMKPFIVKLAENGAFKM